MPRVDRELAKMLYPKPSDVVQEAMGGKAQAAYAYGTAASDSDGGTVTVVMEGETAGVDAAIEVPTSCAISEGDTVLVSVSGNVPVEAVSKGSGDVTREMAQAVSQHFWTDTDGCHITQMPQDEFVANPSGMNLLEQSGAIVFRDGLDPHMTVSPKVDPNGQNLDGANISTDLPGVYLGYDSNDAYIMMSHTLTPGSQATRVEMRSTNNDGSATSGLFMTGSEIDIYGTAITANNDPLLAIDTVQVTVSSTSADSNFSSSAIDVSMNGYTPLGVIQTYWSSGTSQNRFSDYGTHTEGNNLYVRLWNAGSSAASGTLEVVILYAKSEIL